MHSAYYHSRRLEQRFARLHDRLGRAIVALDELEVADRSRPVTPERMAEAAVLCEAARRLLSRHPDVATVPRLRRAPPLVASHLFVALAQTQRLVLTIGLAIHNLSPEPWEGL